MRPIFMICLAVLFALNGIHAQGKKQGKNQTSNKYKIVFQMVSKDTSDHSALIRQIKNILKLEPTTKVEVVCHGPGINIILKEKTLVGSDIHELAIKKVDFVGCEYTMFQKNIQRDQLIEDCRTVPGGIMEIVYKQEKGWRYIKSGY